ncbi:MAG: hypothetical protein J6M02_00275 [Clostridia bacterium]|nr:hypothetical protein [Clostridia bacterium]
MKLFDYEKKLEIIHQMTIAANTSGISLKDKYTAYKNAYALLTDYIDEITSTPLSLGQRISLLHKIQISPVTQEILSYISKNIKAKTFSKISVNNFYSSIFEKMLDAYLICERDTESYSYLMDVMHHNIYLSDLNSVEIILNYPSILKNIYRNNLSAALKDICKVLSSNNTLLSLEVNSGLAKLLTYISAALELPDVYLYSKKLNLDLSILQKDYFTASGLIKDLEYMHYNSNDMKYYKALIKQKSSQNLHYHIH